MTVYSHFDFFFHFFYRFLSISSRLYFVASFKQNMQNRARGLNGLNGVMIINGVVYNGNGLGVDNSYGNGNGWVIKSLI